MPTGKLQACAVSYTYLLFTFSSLEIGTRNPEKTTFRTPCR